MSTLQTQPFCGFLNGCGSIFWCGTFRGDADVWNESVTQGWLFRTSGKTCVESSSTRSFSVRSTNGWMNGWVDGWMKRPAARGLTIRHLLEGFLGGMAGRVRSAATYMGHVCVCVRVDLVANCPAASGTRLERVWNGAWNGYASVALGNTSKQHGTWSFQQCDDRERYRTATASYRTDCGGVDP